MRVILHSLAISTATMVAVAAASNGFEPYQDNGGLVSAIAGRNFVILASDTRMVGPGGYDILTRCHLSSRIWTATDAAVAQFQTHKHELDNTNNHAPMFLPDGSLLAHLPSPVERDMPQLEALSLQKKRTFLSTLGSVPAPVLVGSAGCSTDCEELKRTVRADLRAAHYFAESQLQPNQVATLLSQILYSRRGFPFYSFCVVAGLEHGIGHVYVYDAIGSYEQVCVATCGTGRELLQPILDRKFRTIKMGNDSSSIVQDKDRMQLLGRIPLSQVDCSQEEAMSILLEGYRAVAEREIGVGDQVVFCALQTGDESGACECQVWTAPLKKH